VLSDTTLGTIVGSHGQVIGHAEQTEVAALRHRDDLATTKLLVLPQDQPRRQAGWPKQLNLAVDVALAAEQVCPAERVSWADWDRGKRRAASGNSLGSAATSPAGASTASCSGAGQRGAAANQANRNRIASLKSAPRASVRQRASAI
jgi:hypothetical protein